VGLKRKTPLRNTKPMQRGGRLKPRSAKRDAEMVERRKLVAVLLTQNPWCQACAVTPVGATPARRSVDVHEKLRRSQGGSILDESICLCLCRLCHDWIGQNPQAAVALDLAMWSWQAGGTNPG
jgi:hypothetical protein